MKDLVRVLLFPMAFLAASIYSCYEIFWWAVVEGDSPWMRTIERENPIQSFASLMRDLFRHAES